MTSLSHSTAIGRLVPKIVPAGRRAQHSGNQAARAAAESAESGKLGRILYDFNPNPDEYLARPMIGDDLEHLREVAAKNAYSGE